MSTPKYPNRDALRQAHDIYLDAMRKFVKIRGALEISSHDDVEEIIEISDIAHLVRTYWPNFKGHFDAVDPHYEARSAISLIVEGRNRASHPPWDLDIEFTRTQLFLIAEVLEKINMSAAQREIETIRDKLFDDTAEQLVTTAVEDEKAKYKKSIAEVEKRLSSAEASNKKLSKRITDNDTKLCKKTEDLEKLSKQLVATKLSEKESKKLLKSTTKQLEKVQAEHSACEEHLTTISNQLASTEVERNDYNKCLKTTLKELEEAKAERQMYKDSLSTMGNLFTTSTIGNMVFPPFETDSTVRILDRRNTEKKNYLLNLLEQKQPVIIYVQSEEKIDELLALVGPEKATVIGRHDERTSEAEEAEILEKLEKGELIAIVSNTTLSTLAPSHCVEHFVFCHLVPDLDTFFKRCQPAFTPENNNYLHLIYNNEEDIAGLNQWLTQKYPDKEALRESYRELKKLAKANGGCVNLEEVYNALDIVGLEIETGLVIFEELGFLERDGKGILTLFLSPIPRELEESDTYCRGVELKKETAEFRAFQLECSIEQIWGEILERLNIESEQILRENSIHKIPFRISETEGDYLKDSQTEPEQSTEVVEKDSAASDEIAETDHATKPRRANAKVTDKTKYRKKKRSIAERYVAETTVEDRDGIAAKVVELRINATGSKPLAWKKIREKLGLQNAQFHEVIRHSEGYRKAVIQRIKSLKAQEGGWEYNGKLEVLTGIELTEKELE